MIADLRGKTALVTGAGSGIGAAVVRCFVEQGAVVVASDVESNGVEQLADELGRDAVEAVRLDVTDATLCAQVVREAVVAHERLDLLVCSAGVVLADDREPARDTPADWDRCFAVNVRGVVNSCESVMPVMKSQGHGSIVTIGSISAHGARATLGAYPASKAAALRYAKGLALELAPTIRVNAVCPGAVWSGMQSRILAETRRVLHALDPSVPLEVPTPNDKTAFFAAYEAITPLRRPQRPADVAKAVAFLASDDASEITGQCLHVDGGAIIRD